ncbi:MAG TPA: glycosyltransferase family 4 protein [Paludibacteraceae bacterium]|jgi:glycosyltransferase involved in cell wall biosynthesis|nr:glycosyltransferase family 4 protein [Paludibacteraceae bacterium]HOU67267.1 glycosyltransferase family 4 protein [Paludibacteraceae bacterium]HPH63074.1 glycosyltransferase family 4 protein [Paludibacteraceae bacterium]HQF49400.1 glycosyltransferase family 4 protein [Paludibacteraceae bacterium]HQJ89151.1 glycosyltransferase family 4 protein [Paludibacteraceae bacterium]
MQRKKKIAFVGNTSFSIYNFRFGVVRSFMNEYDVTIIAPRDEYSEFFSKEGIKYIEVPMDSKGTNIFKDIKLTMTLYSIYKKEKFDFVFHYTIKPVIYGSYACRLLNTKCIAITTGLGYTFRDKNIINTIVMHLYKFSLKKVQEVWFLNHDDRRIFIERGIVHEDNTFVLYGEGINSKHFSPAPKKFNDDKFRFLLFSRLLKDKGIVEYAMAAKNLHEKYPNMEFRLLGKANNDTLENIPIKTIKEWEKNGFLIYLGESLDVRPFIADSDCVVLPSYYREGIPRCLMEAMSMEKPIITTDNVGCIELISDGINGFQCKQKSVDDLVDKMERIYNLPEEKRLLMGKAGREIIKQKFDEEIVIREYQNKIKQLI